jgi:hypothetical protein
MPLKWQLPAPKMLQIARETDRTGNPNKNPKTERSNSQNNSGPGL